MIKMHLGARAPNEGARQLAQWILREHGGCLARAAHAVPGWEVTTFDRLLAGDIVPGSAIIEPLAQRAGIEWRAWRRPPLGGWFDIELAQAA